MSIAIKNIAAIRNRVDRGTALVVTFIAVYVVTFSVFTIVRYEKYNATGYDLGIFTQLTWNAAHGRPLQNTIAEQNNMLGVHSPYITIVLAPLFWLWADPRMLLIAQSVLLGIGAWPLARLARRHFSQWWIPPVFAAMWLLYPSLGFNNRWDFHEIAPAATFFAFAFEAADRRAWPQVDLWLTLAILCKEEIGLSVAAFGLYMLWRFKRKRTPCLIWFIGGLAWFVVHAFVIFPILRNAPNGLPIHAVRYTWLLSGNLQTMINYVLGPDTLTKIAFLIKLFGPVAFISLLDPLSLVVAVPTLALSLLSSFEPQFDIFLHYTPVLIAVVLSSSVYGAEKLRDWLARRQIKRPERAILGVALTASILAWLIYNPLTYLPPYYVVYGWEPGAHVDALHEVESLIPPDACVVAGNQIQAHYSARPETYVVGARGDMDGCAYMIIDMSDSRFNTEFTIVQEVACYQYWSRKRVPIYYRDTVVVLQQAPAQINPDAQQGFDAYCASYAKGQGK
ncbi:MAG TPA: DUF2079 domain-containing protein [Aggregatilineales bacterium]|nr:DUF2079 domain-containing protein [Aggregatilineales bacterium]